MLQTVVRHFKPLISSSDDYKFDEEEQIFLKRQFQELCDTQHEIKGSYLGKYAPPSTSYLSSGDETIKDDETALMDLQESNILWLQNLSSQNSEQVRTFLEKFPYTVAMCVLPTIEEWREVGKFLFISENRISQSRYDAICCSNLPSKVESTIS